MHRPKSRQVKPKSVPRRSSRILQRIVSNFLEYTNQSPDSAICHVNPAVASINVTSASHTSSQPFPSSDILIPTPVSLPQPLPRPSASHTSPVTFPSSDLHDPTSTPVPHHITSQPSPASLYPSISPSSSPPYPPFSTSSPLLSLPFPCPPLPPSTPSLSSASTSSHSPSPPLSPTPTSSPGAMAPPMPAPVARLPLHEYTQASKFRGKTGISVKNFLQEVRNTVTAADIPQAEFDQGCLKLALVRCDSDVPEVARALERFSSLPTACQTWNSLVKILSNTFSRVSTSSLILFTELSELQPKSSSEADIADFINLACARITEWATADSSTKFAAPCLDEAHAETHAAFLIKCLLLRTVPNALREKVDEKITPCDIHSLPRVFARAVKPINGSLESPSNAVFYANSKSPAQPAPGRDRGGQSRGNLGTHAHHTPTSRPQHRSAGQNVKSPLMPPNPEWFPDKNSCWNCLSAGHISSRCTNRPLCPWHNTRSHNFLQCHVYQHMAEKIMASLRIRRPLRTAPSFFTWGHSDNWALPDSTPQDPTRGAQDEYIDSLLQ